MKPKILITDDEVHVENILDQLETFAEVIRSEDNREETLVKAAQNVDLIIVSCFTKITAAVLENAKSLKAVLKYGVGVDNIDMDAATQNNVLVVNCPDYGSDTIAEHAFALIICLAKKLLKIDALMRQKGWLWPSADLLGTDLDGETLGLIGFGRIGRAMARKASGFGMKIKIYDPYVGPDLAREFQAEFVSLETLLKTSDVVSIHCILTPETKHLIAEAELKMMKKSAFLIDVSRGAIIRETALLTALQENQIGGSGLDVFADEPLKPNHPFFALDNVILTPHLAWYTKQAQNRLEQETLQRTLEIFEGRLPQNIKNPQVLEKKEQPDAHTF
jgi:D-3-phosphoglycerate dehydrogenase